MQKIIKSEPPLIINTEGLNEDEVTKSMLINNCRKVTKFELILLDSAIVYLCTLLNLNKERLLDKKDDAAYLFRELMVKLLLKVSSLSEDQICILLNMDRNSLHIIKNNKLRILEHDKDFMQKYSSLIKKITDNKHLIAGNTETYPNIVLTRRLHELIENS